MIHPEIGKEEVETGNSGPGTHFDAENRGLQTFVLPSKTTISHCIPAENEWRGGCICVHFIYSLLRELQKLFSYVCLGQYSLSSHFYIRLQEKRFFCLFYYKANFIKTIFIYPLYGDLF